jgi:hypothetical protein
MRYRKLRITWSVFCGIACLLLCAMWARSFYETWWLEITIRNAFGMWCETGSGELFLSFDFARSAVAGNSEVPWIEAGIMPLGQYMWNYMVLGFYIGKENESWLVRLPFWFAAIGGIALAIAPWTLRSNRFSLRTLLIATTLVAVVLGAIVWAVR